MVVVPAARARGTVPPHGRCTTGGDAGGGGWAASRAAARSGGASWLARWWCLGVEGSARTHSQ